MAKAPLAKLSKPEILKLHRWRCKHGHSGITHYNCWLKEHDISEKIGFLDIESSGLKANFAVMLTYCIKVAGEDTILKGQITKSEITGPYEDKELIRRCIEDMRKFDVIIGHYSSRFDIPFLRSRAIHWKLKFPEYGEIKQRDTWRMAKTLLAIHSNRQGAIAQFLQGTDIKTSLNNGKWIQALQGDSKALEYVMDHNAKDVLQLEQNYLKMEPYFRKTNTSI